ncbi:hypothetical protein [Bartonella apihabitans]|uniref:hypothetical protein n=1 Tax=Bartonella apihabitans TaxID=2750929 RepID=UPI0039979B35
MSQGSTDGIARDAPNGEIDIFHSTISIIKSSYNHLVSILDDEKKTWPFDKELAGNALALLENGLSYLEALTTGRDIEDENIEGFDDDVLTDAPDLKFYAKTLNRMVDDGHIDIALNAPLPDNIKQDEWNRLLAQIKADKDKRTIIGLDIYNMYQNAGYSEQQMADTLGIEREAFIDIATGQTPIRVETLVWICTVLRIDPSALLFEAVYNVNDKPYHSFRYARMIYELNDAKAKGKEYFIERRKATDQLINDYGFSHADMTRKIH